MELGLEWIEWGLWSLFLASFIAATILPFSSEAVVAFMATGGWDHVSILCVASIGNWLGGMTNYGLGRVGRTEKLEQWITNSPAKRKRWFEWSKQQGHWVALLCWLPVIGDPIAIMLGISKAKVIPVAMLMLVGKALRYAVILAIMRGLFT